MEVIKQKFYKLFKYVVKQLIAKIYEYKTIKILDNLLS